MPVCVKTIAFWFRKVLSITKAHMSPGTLHGAVLSAAFVTSILLVPSLQGSHWARVSHPAKHYFSSNITAMDRHQGSIHWAVLGLSE